ncbi:c-type cytochrome [Indioceanicola profundi]|uniref:c-type cytochrome n=1 Tax=Indioceanicola profundi TaxID=2220096 RepID=UPI000E6AD7A9|nr:c-type cytochrome [Indioceanicola profundi]
MRLPVLFLLFLTLTACNEAATERPASEIARHVAGGDPEIGRRILNDRDYGCGACHAIPGVRHARGSVGPPLHGMAVRGYVAGRLPNYPENLVNWIYDPQRIDPQSAMPNTGISREEATHVAAYLYTLQELPR